LSRPGLSIGQTGNVLVVMLLAIWFAAALTLWAAPAQDRAMMILGQTWRVCSAQIALLAAPALAILLLTVRRLAPTNLRFAGASAGLLAGLLSALVYTLRCPEMSVAFCAVWYSVGVITPAVIGAGVGPKILRW
jgi:hypothetical protein